MPSSDYLRTTYRNVSSAIMLLLIVTLTGCATPSPEVSEDFEANWATKHYSAKAYLIPSAPEAFVRRVDLIRNAETSIDITYFSWDKDALGLILLNELKKAADRGVQVRLALDDLLVFNEQWLADIDAHHNIQIRIFNPFNSRKMGWLGRATDFQLNQDKLDNRLHEKYFNVDHHTLLLGGRNIGNEYFGYSQKANFYDLDVIFKGNVINAFADNYESLWQSGNLIPISQLIMIKEPGNYSHFNKEYEHSLYYDTDIIADILYHLEHLTDINYLPVTVTPVFDSIKKLDDNKPYFRSRVKHLIKAELDNAQHATISSPYMVPTNGKFEILEQLTNQGANVQVVTNSSASNDSGFIPAYYEKHRETLLSMGINIFEYKDQARNSDHYYHTDTYYHNKTIILDNKVSYIGSSNFDPRSDFLNLELGLIVYSEDFATQLHHYLFKERDSLYWQVTRDSENNTLWLSEDHIYDSNPNYSHWHAFPDWVIRKMDGESEL
ncbi:phospholipase [Vibrio sp. 10N.286.49.B3]|uniref:phospholipase D family protein n=1 Tax=Vibrio sp. 10N.286.49.B3 TaxID=1880855 RepID=UPI000C85031F|nr:phospholipase D family protein [Vibrio sp. 10N.286.49.B3]PMH43284.1 phospholipase [Vibrio sp. 10N.286.49.B3]